MSGELWLPGPLHPDLFGGETPIMERFEGKVFEVLATVTHHEQDEHRLLVLADDEEEAEAMAERLLRRRGDFGTDGDLADDLDVDIIKEHELMDDGTLGGAAAMETLRRQAADLVQLRAERERIDTAMVRAGGPRVLRGPDGALTPDGRRAAARGEAA